MDSSLKRTGVDVNPDASSVTSALFLGDVARLIDVEFRRALAVPLSQMEPLDPESWELRGRALQLEVLMVNATASDSLAAPFVAPGTNGKLKRTDGVDTIEQAKRESAPLLLGCLANYCYRAHAFKLGEELAEAAERGWEKIHTQDMNAGLARLENALWRARLLLRLDQQSQAEWILSWAMTRLEDIAAESWARGGAELLLAIGHNLRASAYWLRSDLDAAKLEIALARHNLQGGAVNDPVRLAHTLEVSGRIASSGSRADLYRSMRELTDSRDKYSRAEHPFWQRTTAVLAMSCIKSGDFGRAERELNSLKTEDLDLDERRFVEADRQLAEIWICEHRAEGDQILWRECQRLAQSLVDVEGQLPVRLEAEGLLHLGRAEAHFSNREIFERGVAHLEHALVKARNADRRGVAVAACFALSEAALSETGADIELARYHWKTGVAVLAQIRSSYLDAWREKLAYELDQPIVIRIEHRQSYADAKRAFMHAYVEQQVHRSSTMKEFLDRTRMSRPSAHRLLRETKLEQEFGDAKVGPGRQAQRHNQRRVRRTAGQVETGDVSRSDLPSEDEETE